MSEKLWAVSSGNYSDYRVHALFRTEEAAQAHAREYNRIKGCEPGVYDAANVESFLFYDGETPLDIVWYETNLRLFITGDLEGDLEPEERHEFEYEDGYRPADLFPRPSTRITPFDDRSSPGHPCPPRFDLRVTGSDRHAVGKTASGIVAQWRANGYRIPGYEIPAGV